MKKLTLQRVRISRTLEGCSGTLVKCHALEAHPMIAHLQATASLQTLETTLRTRTEEHAAIQKAFEEGRRLSASNPKPIRLSTRADENRHLPFQ